MQVDIQKQEEQSQNREEQNQLLLQNNEEGYFVQQTQIHEQLIQQNYVQQFNEPQQVIQTEIHFQQNIEVQQAQIYASQIQVQAQLMTAQQAIEFLSSDPIPDQFSFAHQFISTSPNFELCGGRFQERSTIILPSIGELNLDVDFTMPCRLCEPRDPRKLEAMISKFIPQTAVTFNREVNHICCFQLPCTNEHFLPPISYQLQNDKVRIEFMNNVGKFYILGVLIFELIQCYPTYQDLAQASMLSTMPQMMVYQPQQDKNPRIRVKAERNRCPEHPYSLQGYQSIFGCCKIQRSFQIFGLKQGNCQIFNRRQKCDACLSHCGYRDSWICRYDKCNFVDYPQFEVKFENVTYIDRLQILFCLIHYQLYNKWEHTNYKGKHLVRQIARASSLVQQQAASSCQLI